MLELRESLLQIGFGRYRGKYAGSLAANNKLDLGYENLQPYSEIYGTVIAKLGELSSRYEPDLLLPVPYAANGYAGDIGRLIATDSVCLSKNQLTNVIHFPGNSRAMIAKHGRIVILEDVVDKFTNTTRLLSLPGMAARVVAVVSIWDRGDMSSRPALPTGIGLSSIVQEYIPQTLEEDSGLWRFAA
jgi:hypothetical protein